MKLVTRATSKKTALLSALLLIAGTLLVATPSLGQTAEPTIAFLNPSSFATAGERGIIVSDAAPTAGPGCCEGVGRGYHLSAWVANAPPDARVFFSVVQRSIDMEITDTKASSDGATWETNWRIPDELMDGPATLFAHLVLNEEQIAFARQEVTILRLQANVQIRYPDASGQFGTYAALADGLSEGEAATRTPPVGVVDALYTEDADIDRLRVFYTTSVPGVAPKWTTCGTETLSGAPNGLRCTLASLADEGKVTAIAAVANDSANQGPYEVRMNQSGDAVAVGTNYQQELAAFQLSTSGQQRVNRDTQPNAFPCSDGETVRLTDQVGRAIAGANIDAHAAGPTDTLKFDHDSLEIWTDTTLPDRGVHGVEPSYDCFTHPGNSDPGEQAEHQRFGAPDRKHVESQFGGTTDLGQFTFAMRSTTEGLTDWTAWVDEADDGCAANDDVFAVGELNVSGSVGWGQNASFPIAHPTEAMMPCVPTEPSPGPSESPTEEPLDGSRTVSLRIRTNPIVIGKPATFVGRIGAADTECAADQLVKLKVRRPGQKFWTKTTTRTDDQGRFKMVARARAPRDYRAVAPAAGGCDRARSVITRLRA